MQLEAPTEKQKKRLASYMSSSEKLIYVTTVGRRYFWVNLILLLFIPLVLTYYAMFAFLGVFEITSLPWFKYVSIVGLLLLIYDTPKYSHLVRMRQSYTYALTSRRFLIIRGILSRKIVTAPLTAITHVTVEQNMFQRFLYNSGHLVIITAGFDQREIVIEHIGDPLKFKIMIEELTEKLDDRDNLDEDTSEDEDEYLKNRKKKTNEKDFKLRSLPT